MLQEGVGGFNEVLESLLLVSKRFLLVFEVGKEGFPVLLRLFFSESGGGLFFEDGGSDVLEEIQDFHDVFVVKLGGELGE